jgi:TolB-like protein
MSRTDFEKSVAVLPFVAMSKGPDDEYFADGLTEEILNSLAQLPELLVTARTSAFAFKGQDVPIPDIARKLGVAHVVEGSVRRDGDRLRITAQLIRAHDGFHVWSETYARSGEDVFGVQAEIAEKIASALDVILDNTQLAKMRSVGLRNPEAFIAYQKGLELYDLSHGSNNDRQIEMLGEANKWFDTALALSPDLFDAYVRHSDRSTHLLISASNGRPIATEDLDAATRQIEKDFDQAINYAPDASQRLAASLDRALLTGRWQGLSAMIDEIVRQPGCKLPLWVDVAATAYGKAREVLAMQERQINCDPLNYRGWYNLVQSYNWLGDFDNAIEVGTRGLESSPHNLIREQLAVAHLGAGQFKQAAVIIDRDIRGEQLGAELRVKLAAATGDVVATNAMIDAYVASGFNRGDQLIVMYALSGDRERANQLAATVDARPYGYLSLMQVPLNCYCGSAFDLDATPHFAKLLNDANLPWPTTSPIDWPLKNW